MLPGEDGPVGEHLGEDAADGPDVYGLGVALQRERDRDPAAPAMKPCSGRGTVTPPPRAAERGLPCDSDIMGQCAETDATSFLVRR